MKKTSKYSIVLEKESMSYRPLQHNQCQHNQSQGGAARSSRKKFIHHLLSPYISPVCIVYHLSHTGNPKCFTEGYSIIIKNNHQKD